MAGQRISTEKALRLLLKSYASRTLRQIATAGADNVQQRSGTRRKGRSVPFTLLIVLLAMGFTMSFWTLVITLTALSPSIASFPYSEAAGSSAYFHYLALLSLGWFFTILLISIGYQNRDLAVLDADVESLLSLPISPWTIYLSKVIERTVLSLGWLILLPFYGWVLWLWGYRFSLLFLALFFTLVTNSMLAAAQFALELLCRRIVPVTSLNRIQAVATLLGSLLLIANFLFPTLLASEKMGMAVSLPPDFPLILERIGSVACYLPTAFPLNLCAFYSAKLLALHALEILIVATATLAIVEWSAKRGLEAVHSGRASARIRPKKHGSSRLFTGIAAKDLIMLRRDGRVLANLIGALFPVVVFLLFPNIRSFPMLSGAVSLWVGFLVLMGGAPNALLHERGSLWLLYTVPQSFKKILLHKALLWTSLAFSMFLLVLGLQNLLFGADRRADLISIVWALATLPLAGIFCVSLGILGTDTTTEETARRIKEEYLGIAMLSFLIPMVLILPGWWIKLCCLLLFGAMAAAWWQKAEEQFDYLLDPTALPPPRLHAADGLTAAILFFIVSKALAIGLLLKFTMAQTTAFVISYAVSAAITTGVLLSELRSQKVSIRSSLSLLRKEGWLQNAGLIAGGIVMSYGIAYVWTHLLPSIPFFRDFAAPQHDTGFFVVLLRVVMAPVFEEFLFRGILFGALRQRWGFWPSAALSSVIFAMLHSPSLFVVMLIQGMILAAAYDRSKMLATPILIRAILGAISQRNPFF
jgi:hypothetical protein